MDSARTSRTSVTSGRPNAEISRLFAAALEDDPLADDELRRLAVDGDPTAEKAFRARCVAEHERESRQRPERFAPSLSRP